MATNCLHFLHLLTAKIYYTTHKNNRVYYVILYNGITEVQQVSCSKKLINKICLRQKNFHQTLVSFAGITFTQYCMCYIHTYERSLLRRTLREVSSMAWGCKLKNCFAARKSFFSKQITFYLLKKVRVLVLSSSF